VSTMVGMPAVAPVLPPVDSRRFPFTAALLHGVDEVARIADQAIEHLELDAKAGPTMGAAYSRMELRMLARSAQQWLRPQLRTLPGLSPFASEWGKAPADVWPARASRID
jgi:hypothetical protein